MEKNKWHAFLFLLPSIFFFVVFSYWPLLQNLYLSFFSWNMVSPNMTFVGIENYTAVLGSEELIKILANTVVFVAIMLVLNAARAFTVQPFSCRQLFPLQLQVSCSCGFTTRWLAH